MSKRRAAALASAVVVTVALALSGGVVRVQEALAQAGTFQIAARERVVAGRTEGEVLVGSNVILRIRAAAGGLTPTQRAQTIARRLQDVLRQEGLTPQDVRVARVDGEYAVMVRDDLVITADAYQAALNRTTPRRLATTWRNNLADAVATVAVAGFRGDLERTSAKIVPIVSIGSGVRVGAARVAGPASRVDDTSVIGQIETTFQDVVRIRILVPLGNISRLDRVPEVAVTAYGDIQL
ncbi:MAG: hypothetical protein HY321_10875 [Armatimonadetes bacterium]|nr:hypothetical protein [Armatimonadota bacterium]